MNGPEKSSKQQVNPEDLICSSPSSGEELPEFTCDNEFINQWFRDESLNAHQLFDCRVTHVRFIESNEIVGFYSICLQAEPVSDFSGLQIIDRIFEGHRVITVHLKWLAVRTDLQQRKIAKSMMVYIIDDFYEIITRCGAYAVTVQYMNTASEKLYRDLGFSDYGLDGQKKLYIAAQAVVDLVEE